MKQIKQEVKQVKIAVIGGGAAGMMAAIAAARQGASVTILEKNSRLGKKLSQTGNGRCNYTNLELSESGGNRYYRSGQAEFPWRILEKFSPEDSISFFQELGIYPKYRGSYVYPGSDQASSLVNVLIDEIRHLNINVIFNCDVAEIAKDKKGFLISAEEIEVLEKTKGKQSGKSNSSLGGNSNLVGNSKQNFNQNTNRNGNQNARRENSKSAEGMDELSKTNSERLLTLSREHFDKVILTAGSKAFPLSGSDGSGYSLAEKLGHHIIPVVPALCGLKCKEHIYKDLAGVRVDAELRLSLDERVCYQERGELQLTDYGISGIPVFQFSRFANYGLLKKKKPRVSINFLPDFTEGSLFIFLKKRAEELSYKACASFLEGLLNQKLSGAMLRFAGIPERLPVSKLSKEMLKELSAVITGFTTEVIGSNPFANAQCAAGGADTKEVNPETLESKLVPGFYMAGEILDVDGVCGGYNLQFAWASGKLAGEAAGGSRSVE